MSIIMRFEDSTSTEEMDADDFEVSNITQDDGWLIVTLVDASSKVLSVHTHVRSVWKQPAA